METLELTDEQSPQFIGLFADFRQKTRQVNEEVDAKIDSLSDMLQSDNPSEEKVKEAVMKIDTLKEKRLELFRKFHTDIEKLLTVMQMGKMVVFEERFERELIENVRGFRMKNKPPVNP
jgi:Spy/CpxP family protein refolding chaperone